MTLLPLGPAMATDPSFAQHICDQIAGAAPVAVTKMFGEYGVYCQGKVVALLCDNQLFLKPTPGALALIVAPSYGPPYPGAKPHLRISDEIDDADLMAQLVRAVAGDLPEPKPKKPKKPKTA